MLSKIPKEEELHRVGSDRACIVCADTGRGGGEVNSMAERRAVCKKRTFSENSEALQ